MMENQQTKIALAISRLLSLHNNDAGNDGDIAMFVDDNDDSDSDIREGKIHSNCDSNMQKMKLCEEIYNCIHDMQQPVNNKNASQQSQTPPQQQLPIRTVLAKVPVSSLRQIGPVLSLLLSDRSVDLDNDELPFTLSMDDDNEGVRNPMTQKSNSKSIHVPTITKLSMISAQLYGCLLSLPGSIGIGLLQIDTISILYNIIRQWKMELIHTKGNHANSSTTSHPNDSNTSGNHKKKKKGNGDTNNNRKTWQKKKRTKGNDNNGTNDEHDNSSSSSDDSDDDDAMQPTNKRILRGRRQLSGSTKNNKTNQQKLLRQQQQTINGSDDDLDDNDDTASNNQSSLVILSPSHELYHYGLMIASYLVQLPIQKEFTSWSYEVQEIIIKCVCLILATLKAVSSSTTTHDDDATTSNNDSISIQDIIQKASYALEQCIFLPYDVHKTNSTRTNKEDDDDDDPDDDSDNNGNKEIQKRHEVTKFVLRGLLPIITFEEIVPNGEQGKVAAGNGAFHVLQKFLQNYRNSCDLNDNEIQNTSKKNNNNADNSQNSNLISTPTTPSSSLLTPKTGTIRKGMRRLSDGGSNGSNRMMIMSPKLKNVSRNHNSNKTPGTSVRFAGRNESDSQQQEQQPCYNYHHRPIISLIFGFLQKLISITNGRERAANRTYTINGIRNCLYHLPKQNERYHFLFFMIQLCQSKLSIHRLMATEFVGSVLQEEWVWEYNDNHDFQGLQILQDEEKGHHSTPSKHGNKHNDNYPNNHCNISLTAALLRALQGRLSDRYPTIRSASANSLANILRRFAEECVPRSKNHVNDNTPQPNQLSMSAIGMTSAFRDHAFSLIEMLRRRILNDDKATVRRACILALVELITIGEASYDIPISLSEIDVSIHSDLCQDTSSLTRRAASDGLTRLLDFAVEYNRAEIVTSLERAWSSSTLLMVLDSEMTCSNKAIELFDRVLIEPILSSSDEVQNNNRQLQSAWRILASLGCGGVIQGASRSENEALRVALGKSIVAAPASGYIVQIFKLIFQIATKTLDKRKCDLFARETEEQRTGVWCLFDAAMEYTKNLNEIKSAIKRSKIDLNFLSQSWDALLELYQSSETPKECKRSLQSSMQNCLKVLSKLADLVDPASAKLTSDGLRELIAEFSLPPELTGSALAALTATIVSYSTGNGEDGRKNCSECVRHLYRSCEREIDSCSSYLLDSAAISKISKALYTIGELSMIGFSSDEDCKQNEGSMNDERIDSPGVRGLLEHPSSKLIEFVQALMAETAPGLSGTTNPDSIRAHAFVAFGKLCLRNEKLTEQSLNIFARELQQNGNPAVQSNALLILGDLCVRYTNLVDRFLPVMAKCLQAGVSDLSVTVLGPVPYNESALVRKHAIIVLSNLILQDFIKWRGLLFHRFLVACADEEDDVANLAEMVLVGPLLSKQAKLFSNQFVESFFVLNRCSAHPIYVAAASMGDGGSGISVGFDGINLSGEIGRVRRMKMYHLMLSKMTDEEKIGVTARIAKDILDGAVNGTGYLHRVCTITLDAEIDSSSKIMYESAFNVVSDALTILTSSNIRVGNRNSNREDDDDVEDSINEPTNNAKKVQLAKGRLLSNVSRKHMIDTLLPIFCNLKTQLQNSCSSLLKELMACLVEFYNLYKDEVRECLASDPTLLQEIDYDARQYKKIQRGYSTTPATNRKKLPAE